MTKGIGMKLNNQSGAALVIAMIMMIVLTLIGLASTFSSTFESKLSGNKRESTGAFFTAEAGLEAAKSTNTNFDTTVNYVDRGALPANLADEAIDLVRTSTNLNLPGGSTFNTPPAVTIYHLRAGGEGTRSYRADRYIIDSTGRDQLAGFALLGSRCEIREKRLLRSLGPFSEMEN